MIGQTIGQYEVLERLGEGGMGEVYRARDVMLDRRVALKRLLPELSHDPKALERFHVEARTLARLHHQNLAQLYTYFEVGGRYHIVMEFLEGQSLQSYLQSHGAVKENIALGWIDQAMRGLHHAHAQHGIVHRDLKPANLFLTTDKVIKVVDFGIAYTIGAQRMTKTGYPIGSPAFMAPEQFFGRAADARTDVYAVAVVLYQLLTGRTPFCGDTFYDYLLAHTKQAVPALPEYISQPVRSAISCALEKDPESRFRSMEDFRVALHAPSLPSEAARARAVASGKPSWELGVFQVEGNASPLTQVNATPAEVRPASLASQQATSHSRLSHGGWVLMLSLLCGATLLVGFYLTRASNSQVETVAAVSSPILTSELPQVVGEALTPTVAAKKIEVASTVATDQTIYQATNAEVADDSVEHEDVVETLTPQQRDDVSAAAPKRARTGFVAPRGDGLKSWDDIGLDRGADSKMRPGEVVKPSDLSRLNSSLVVTYSDFHRTMHVGKSPRGYHLRYKIGHSGADKARVREVVVISQAGTTVVESIVSDRMLGEGLHESKQRIAATSKLARGTYEVDLHLWLGDTKVKTLHWLLAVGS